MPWRKSRSQGDTVRDRSQGWPSRHPADGVDPVDPLKLRSLIYRQYGAFPDATGIAEDRTGTLDRLAPEVASSLIQQRERLLDLSEEMVAVVAGEHCPPSAHAEDWDLERLARAVKERFGFEADLTAKGRRAGTRDADRVAVGRGGEGDGGARGRILAAGAAVFQPAFLPGGDRSTLDRPPEGDGGAARGHRPARLRPEGPQAGIQKGRLTSSSAR